MSNSWITTPVWHGWGEITRLHGSASLAFRAELESWSERQFNDETELVFTDGGSEFRTFVPRHISTLQDVSLLHQVALLRYYSLMEAHSRFAIYVLNGQRWNLLTEPPKFAEIDEIEAIVLGGGLEAWAKKLIIRCEQDWSKVYGGLLGLVEVSIVRNCLAHGRTIATGDILQASQARGVTLPFEEGERFELTFTYFNEYRGRMRSFCRIVSDGLVHIARGTGNDA